MGLTLQQAQAQGFKAANPQQSAAATAYQNFGKPAQTAVISPNSPASPALKSFIETGAAPGATPPKQGTVANLPSSIVPAAKEVGNEYKGAFTKSVDELSNVMVGKENAVQAGMNTEAAFVKPLFVDPANLVLSPVGHAANAVFGGIGNFTDFITGKPQGTTNLRNAQDAQGAQQAYQQWAQKNPTAAASLNMIGTNLQAGMNIAGANSLAEGAKAGAERVTPQIKDAAGNITNKVSDTMSAINDKLTPTETAPKPVKFTPEMQVAHDNLTEAQQAFEDAKVKANSATVDRQQGVENSKTQVAKVKQETQSGIQESQAKVQAAQQARELMLKESQAKVQAAQQAREQVAPQAVKGASDIQSGVKAGEKAMGATFGKTPAQIEAADPTARYNLSQKDLAELNSIKEDRKFSLPDYLNQENNPQPNIGGQTLDTGKMNPKLRAQIEAATGQMQGETAKSLTPTQTQDLIRQINSKVYNPLTGEVDQRLIDLSNRIKSGAQSSFGHVVDANGESIWDKAYQSYSQGMQTSENLKTLMGVNPNKDLADVSPNKLLENINDLGKSPEGKIQLQQIADEFKQNSGVDLNKPIKNVQQIADAEAKIKQAQNEANQTQKITNKSVSEAQKNASVTEKNLTEKQIEAQKNASQTTKSLVKNEIASREEVQARKADIAKAQAEIDKMEKAKLTTTQKIAKLTKSKGLKWADYALRFIVIRELYKAITSKSGG